MFRLRLFAVIVAALAIVSGQVVAQSGAVPSASIVAEFSDLLTVGRTSTLLSPDGRRVAHMEGDRICIYDLIGTALSRERCVPTDDLRLWNLSPRWSPDGRWLVMTENWVVFLYEPDIWVLDTDSLSLTNLTDDESAGGFERDNSAQLSDVYPEWYRDADGEYRIAFLRLDVGSDNGSAMLMSIGVDDLQPTELGLLPNSGRVPIAFTISPDGSKAANIPFSSAGDSCLYITDTSDLTSQTLHCYTSRGDIPQGLHFNASGNHLMTFNFNRYFTGTGPNFARIWNVASGEEIVPDLAENMLWAMWGRTGTSLITLVEEGDSRALYYAASAGADAGLMLEGEFVPVPDEAGLFSRLTRNNLFVIGQRESPAVHLIEIDLPLSGWG